MPNTRSAAKRMKTSQGRRERNESIKARMRRVRRQLADSIAKGDKAASEAQLCAFCAVVDKAAKKNIINVSGAARRKARAAARVAGAFSG